MPSYVTSQKSEKETVCSGDIQGHGIVQLTKPRGHDVVLEKAREEVVK